MMCYVRGMAFDPDGLADLSSLGLSAEALAARRGFVNASEVPIILAGDAEARRQLARYHLGGPPADLSERLEVTMGTWTEPLNLAWFKARTGLAVSRKKLLVSNPEYPWLRATLDGWIEDLGVHIECKHTNAFAKLEDTVAWYFGQLQMQMLCAGTTVGRMSIFFGNHRWAAVEVPYDPFWVGDVLPLLERWHAALARGEMPEPDAAPPPPAPAFDDMVEVDLTGNNAFADAAGRWLAHRDAARSFEQAVVDLKELVPANARRASGHGIVVTRNRRGAVSIAAADDAGANASEEDSPAAPRRSKRKAAA